MDKVDKLAYEIEAMVDRNSMARVLDLLAIMCAMKADHIHSNWGDRNLAKAWTQLAEKVAKACAFAEQQQL
ncbi:MAG: hypothetical protein SF187_23640 [Deltaproteobacteria bacterium]|nr:hypothetical protein [Deltaproteobacteria bacterium]